VVLDSLEVGRLKVGTLVLDRVENDRGADWLRSQ